MEKDLFKKFKSDIKHLTETQLLESIESMRTQDSISTYMRIEDSLKAGQLSDTTFIFRDESEGFMIERNGVLQNFNENTMKSFLVQFFNFHDLNFIHKSMFLIPIVSKEFNPTIFDKKYRRGDMTMYNTFSPTPLLKSLTKDISRHNFDIKVVKKDFPATYLLLWNLFQEDSHIEFFINWFSTCLNIREKTGVCIALIGSQGTGKNSLFDYIIKPAVEQHAISLDNERLRGKFNSELENTLFVLWNEIKGDFKDTSTTADKLKALVSDKQYVIEKKGKDSFQAQTYFNNIICSNHQLPFEVDLDDRRFFLVETRRENLRLLVQRELKIHMETYFNLLKEESTKFLQYVAYLNFSIQKARIAPVTKTKTAIAESCTSQFDKLTHHLKNRTPSSIEWIYNSFTDMYIQNEELETSNFEDLLKRFLKEIVLGEVSISSLTYFYKFYVNKEATAGKIEKDLKVSFGETQRNRKNRYKFLGDPFIFNFEKFFETNKIFGEDEENFNEVIEKVYG